MGGYEATWVTSSEESQNYRISREQQGHVLEDGAALLDGPWYFEHTLGCKSHCVCREESCACSGWCEVCDGLPRIRSALGTSEAEKRDQDAVLALNP